MSELNQTSGPRELKPPECPRKLTLIRQKCTGCLISNPLYLVRLIYLYAQILAGFRRLILNELGSATVKNMKLLYQQNNFTQITFYIGPHILPIRRVPF